MGAAGGQTRDHLLAVATEVLVRDGADGLSLRDVARRADVSAAAVYRHFASKEALVDAVVSIGFQKLCWYLLQATSEKTPRARLDAAGAAYLRFALENPQDYRAIFMTPCKTSEKVVPGEAFQLLVDRVRECMDARVLVRADVIQTATTIWAHVHGLASLRLSGHLAQAGTDAEFKRFYEQSVGKLMTSLEVNTVHKRKSQA